ncbi:MAG: hypothetical protein ACKPKO_45655, partial [Candidatus Fonsibacter sp.]
ISTATQTALDGKADKTNTYTKGDVDITKISNLIASAPESLNTLNELAQALANDPNHATCVFNQLATKAATAYADGQLALKAIQSNTYTMTQVDNAPAGKQPSITSSTALGLGSSTATGSATISKLISNFIKPLVSGGSIFIRSDVIGVGRTAFMTASSDSISTYAPLRAEKRTKGSEWHYIVPQITKQK